MSLLGSADDRFRRYARGLLGPLLGLVGVVVLFGILRPSSFLGAENFRDVLRQSVMVGFGALGMTFVIAAGGIDLSVGSVMALASVVTALLLRAGFGVPAAVAGGILSGVASGALAGTLVVGLRIVPFIVTLGTMGIARGVAKALGKEQPIDAPPSGLEMLTASVPDPSWLVLPIGVWLLLIAAIFFEFVLTESVFGVHTLAIGSNEATARLCGVPVGRRKIMIYTLAGLLAGVAGVVLFGRLTVGDPTAAAGMELKVVAAVVIGGGSLAGGSGTVIGSLLGAFMMSFLENGCTIMGFPNYVQEILTGLVIIAAAALDRLRALREGA